MARSTQAQRAERVRAAQELLARGTSMVEAAVALSRDFGLSRRQAYRYLEEAQAVAAPPVVAEASVTITLKIPSNICTGIAGLPRDQRADHERDRTTRHIGVSVGSAWTWLSGGTSVTSVSNIPLTVCSSPSSNRSIGPSSPIAYGLSASLPRRRPGAAS